MTTLQANEGHRTGLRVDSLATAVGVLLVMTVAQRIVGLVRNILFCRLLDPEQLGQWNLVFSVIVLAAPLLVLGLPGSFGRYVEYHRHRGTLQEFLRRTLRATAVLTLVGVLLLALLRTPTAWLVFGSVRYTSLAMWVAVCLVPIIAFNVLVELATALRQVRLLSIAQFVNSLLFAGLGLSLLVWLEPRVEWVLASYTMACFVSALLMAWPLLATVSESPDTPGLQSHPSTSQREFWGRLLPFAGWIWFSNLTANLFTAVDRGMIIHFAGPDASAATQIVGQYHSSRVVPELIMAVATLLAGVLLPYLTSDWEQGRKRSVSHQINWAIKLFGLASFLGSAILLLVAPWLFNTILQGKYADGLSVLPLTLAHCIWFGQLLLVQQYLLCAERARPITLLLLVGLAVNVVLNYLLLPRWGLAGAVAGTAVANLATLVLTAWASGHHGLRVHHGTWIVLALPATLALGGWIAVCLGMLVLVAGVSSRLVFSNAELARLHRHLRWHPR